MAADATFTIMAANSDAFVQRIVSIVPATLYIACQEPGAYQKAQTIGLLVGAVSLSPCALIMTHMQTSGMYNCL